MTRKPNPSLKAIVPVILSGGAGTRLWLLSRVSRLKQFLNLGSERTLFQETARRVAGAAPTCVAKGCSSSPSASKT